MVNVLIVSKSNSYCVKLLNNLCNNNSEIRITNIVNSIEDMYKITSISTFDIILIDFNLLLYSKLDKGLDNFMKKYKKSIIILNTKNEIITNYSNSNYIIKTNFNEISKKILKISSKKTQNKIIKKKIKKELEYLGYKPSHLGTIYLSEIIFMMYSSQFEGSLQKIIYPRIGKLHKKSTNTIKCNVINATALMYCECPEEKFMNYFGKFTSARFGPKTVIYTILNKLSS